MTHPPKVALVLLNYNCHKHLPACLSSISKLAPQKHIYYVDNGSTDESVSYIKENYPHLNLIIHSSNLGIGRSLNPLLRKLQIAYDYIAIFNTDIVIERNWLTATLSCFNNHPNCALVTSKIVFPTGRIDNFGGTILNFPFGIFGGLHGNDLASTPSHPASPLPVFFGLITAMLIKSSALAKVGYFDEKYFVYFEDIDLSWRLHLAGFDIYCQPRSLVTHYGHGSAISSDFQRFLLSCVETNLLTTYYKNLSIPLFILVLPILLLSRTLMAFVYLPSSPRITISKLWGITKFLFNLCTFRTLKDRQTTQSLRLISDYQLLSTNPTPIFTLTPLFKLISPWLSHQQKLQQSSR